MKKDNIFSIVTMSCGLMLIISVFLPYVTYFSTSLSLWKMGDSSRFIYILLGIFVIVLYLLNKKTELSYLAVGYGVFTSISNIISLEGFSGLSIGFYLVLLSSLAIGILTLLYNEKEADALIGYNYDINNNIEQIGQSTDTEKNLIKFDPMTGEPINNND